MRLNVFYNNAERETPVYEKLDGTLTKEGNSNPDGKTSSDIGKHTLNGNEITEPGTDLDKEKESINPFDSRRYKKSVAAVQNLEAQDVESPQDPDSLEGLQLTRETVGEIERVV